MEFCPECGIGLSNAEKQVCYCRNCHCDFSPEAIKEKKEWNGICKCGHLHSEHGPSGSINYTAGSCTIKGCKCRHFIHQPDSLPSAPSPSIEAGLRSKEEILWSKIGESKSYYQEKDILEAMEEYANQFKQCIRKSK